MHLIEISENDNPEEDMEQDIVNENKIYDRITIPNLTNLWLKYKPS